VSYYVEQLVKLGCIEMVAQKKRRGATEHWYRATVKHFIDADTWKRVPPGGSACDPALSARPRSLVVSSNSNHYWGYGPSNGSS
jgi:hypothetical protein